MHLLRADGPDLGDPSESALCARLTNRSDSIVAVIGSGNNGRSRYRQVQVFDRERSTRTLMTVTEIENILAHLERQRAAIDKAIEALKDVSSSIQPATNVHKYTRGKKGGAFRKADSVR